MPLTVNCEATPKLESLQAANAGLRIKWLEAQMLPNRVDRGLNFLQFSDAANALSLAYIVSN